MKIVRPVSKQPIPKHAKRVFKGKIFDVYQWEQEMFDGSKAIFEKIKRLDTVEVVPIMDDGKILLIEQQQPGKDSVISVPGGRVDEGEDVFEAVKRELLEETGYEAKEWQFYEAIQPVSKIEWVIYTFVAKGLTKVADLKPDSGEKIRLKAVSFDEFVELVISGKYADQDFAIKVFEAKLDPTKMEELRRQFKPA